MVWPPPPVDSLDTALRYSHQFGYPLTAAELWYWQVGTRLSLSAVRRHYPHYPSQSRYFAQRRRRLIYSRPKWLVARRVGESLTRIPTIVAVFVTGSLAMSNSPENDDIDIMIITSPHSLWFTRFCVVAWLTLTRLRRPPHLSEHSSPRVADKICDNLYLDTSHLALSRHDLYTAHEILQAKPLWDRAGVIRRFLTANYWVGEYLPIAYTQSLKKFPSLDQLEFRSIRLIAYLLIPLNLFFYIFQYIYMFPHKTTEKIGLGYAFFHPHSST